VVTRILRSASVCLLLLIFLAGSTGISFYIHTCGESQKKEVLFFREIFHQKIACCCEANTVTSSREHLVSSFNDANCCRVLHLFIKALLLGFPVLEKFSAPTSPCTEYLQFALLQIQSPEKLKVSFLPFPDPAPPPLSGVTLVHFLHQIRIPEPVC